MKFLSSKFDFNSIICLNGDISRSDVEYLQFVKSVNNSIPIIAADGAANKLLHISVDYIIGDMDSLDVFNKDIFSNSKIIKEENQNKYDFEKALDLTINKGLTRVLIIGMNGGEMEHSLNNWSIFVKYSLQNVNLACLTNNRIGIFIGESVTLALSLGEIVSLIPANEAVISSKGLRWELEHFKLRFGVAEGARNCTKSKQIELTLHSGSYVLFINFCK